jgi:hypothetical protein
VDKIARGVDVLAQGWIAHHVEIGERRDPESLAQPLPPASSALKMNSVQRVSLIPGVEGKHAGERGHFHPALEAVGPGVGEWNGSWAWKMKLA